MLVAGKWSGKGWQLGRDRLVGMDAQNAVKTWEDMEWLWEERRVGGDLGVCVFDSFCLCLVEGEEIPEIVGAVDRGTMDFRELFDASYEDWDPSQLLVGRAQVDGWTVLYEVNGFAGVENRLIEPLTEGRRAVALWHSSGNMHNALSVYSDGRCVLAVEPDMPSSLAVDRSRQDLTDGLVSRLEDAGFLIDVAGDTDPDEIMDHNVPASLAFMANESGLDVTPDLIRSLTFTVTAVDASGR